MILNVRRCAVLHEPFQLSRVELLLDSVMQGGFSFGVLMVHVRTACGEKPRSLELLPAPARQKGCLVPDVNSCTSVDQKPQNVEVLPPPGCVQSSTGRGRDLRAALEQE